MTSCPVFPLPQTVFFPETVLPLHIFEPRYRAMVRDAVAGDGRIAMALLQPGWEASYDGAPSFFEVGTVGRIEDLVELPDGRSTLKLSGIERVRFCEVPCDTTYRQAIIESLVEPDVDEDDAELRRAKIDLLALHGMLTQELRQTEQPGQIIFDDRVSFRSATNGVCSTLPVDAGVRQQLLEESDLVRRRDRAAELVQHVLETVLRMKSDSGSFN